MKKKLIRFFVIAAVLSIIMPLIANHKPLYIKVDSAHFFPAFSSREVFHSDDASLNFQLQDFRFVDTVFSIYPLIPWSPGRSDLINSYAGPLDEQFARLNGSITELPLRYRHWLGTDATGSDVLAGILHGFRHSMLLAFIAVALAAAIGIVTGAIAGYFGNSTLKRSNADYIAGGAALLYFAFLLFNGLPAQSAGHALVSLMLVALLYIILSFLMKWPGISFFRKMVSIPADSYIMRLVEVMISMPRLMLILTLASIFPPSSLSLALLLGFTLWPEFTRFSRSQVLQIREQDYILAARALGYSDARILTRHVLKNGSGPLLVVLCFSFTNVILTEAGLAFIGIGLSSDAVTWGTLLSSGKNNFQAWWLIVFPGMAILCTVFFLNHIADRYQVFVRSPLIRNL